VDTRPINATLVVSSFNPTGNPGEYTFENAVYNNQADSSGNGAYDVQIGYVVYVPSTNFNTGIQIPGVAHRYKLTEVNIIDPQTLSGTMIWDETGQEGLEVPTNGVGSALSQASPTLGYGYAPTDSIYPELPAGLTVQSVQTDLWNITDSQTGGGEGPGPSQTYKTTVGDDSALSFTINHMLGTADIDVKVFDLNTGADVYPGIVRTGPNSARLDFTYPIEANSHRVIVRA
jgi:hypothetical protein